MSMYKIELLISLSNFSSFSRSHSKNGSSVILAALLKTLVSSLNFLCHNPHRIHQQILYLLNLNLEMCNSLHAFTSDSYSELWIDSQISFWNERSFQFSAHNFSSSFFHLTQNKRQVLSWSCLQYFSDLISYYLPSHLPCFSNTGRFEFPWAYQAHLYIKAFVLSTKCVLTQIFTCLFPLLL